MSDDSFIVSPLGALTVFMITGMLLIGAITLFPDQTIKLVKWIYNYQSQLI